MRVISLKKIILPREDIFDTRPSRLNDQGRGDTAARRHAAKVECFLDVLGVAVPRTKAGGLMSGVAQEKSHLRSVQARRAPGGRRRTEEWRYAVRAPMTLRFKLLPTQRHCEPRSDVVAKR